MDFEVRVMLNERQRRKAGRMSPIERRAATEAAAAEVFNAQHPVGTMVRAWPGEYQHGTRVEGPTRTTARALCCTAVVWVEGYASCIALTHVDVLPAGGES